MLAQAVDARKREIHRVERVNTEVGMARRVGGLPVEGEFQRVHRKKLEAAAAQGRVVAEMKLHRRVNVLITAVSQHVDLAADGLFGRCPDKADRAGEQLPAPRQRGAGPVAGGRDPVVPAGVGSLIVVRPVTRQGVILAEEGHGRPLAAFEIGAQRGLHPGVGVAHFKAQLSQLPRQKT